MNITTAFGDCIAVKTTNTESNSVIDEARSAGVAFAWHYGNAGTSARVTLKEGAFTPAAVEVLKRTMPGWA